MIDPTTFDFDKIDIASEKKYNSLIPTLIVLGLVVIGTGFYYLKIKNDEKN